MTLNQDLKALVPGSELVAEYLMYLISGMQRELLVEWKKEGATVESLELDWVASTSTPLPAPVEQRAIAAFLDRETAKIDTLVTKKERLLELLQEERTALTTRAVTKGLDPNVSMKDRRTTDEALARLLTDKSKPGAGDIGYQRRDSRDSCARGQGADMHQSVSRASTG